MTTRNNTFVDGFTSQTIPTSARSNATGATGPAGRGITSIVRTSGDGSEGTTDVYTITFTDTTTQTYNVVNGNDGATTISGAADPIASQGNDGDFYLQTTNQRLFGPKVSGAWPSSFLNLKGTPGNADPFIITYNGAFTASIIATVEAATLPSNGLAFFNITADSRTDKTTPINDADLSGNLVVWDGTTWHDQGDFRGPIGVRGPDGSSLNVISSTVAFTPILGNTYNMNQGAAISIQLPTPVANFVFIIKDVSGAISTNKITLLRSSSERIEGLTSNRVLETDFGAWTIYSDGTDWFLL